MWKHILLILLMSILLSACQTQNKNSSQSIQIEKDIVLDDDTQGNVLPTNEISRGAIRLQGSILSIEDNWLTIRVLRTVALGPNYYGTIPLVGQEFTCVNSAKKEVQIHQSYLFEVLLPPESNNKGNILKILKPINDE